MKRLPAHLQKKIKKIPREKYHKVIHILRKKHKIARKTIYYMKEYGPKAHVISEIVKDSLSILLFTSVISSIGGIGLHTIRENLFTILPFLILVPALNDMVGDFGTIVSSRFAAALYLGRVEPKRWWKSKELKKLFKTSIIVASIMVLYIALLANVLATLRGLQFTFSLFTKTLFITAVTVLILFGIIFSLAIFGGIKIFKRAEDPNNFLVPISTSVADFGTLIVFATLVTLLF